jgi:hypothetical protein
LFCREERKTERNMWKDNREGGMKEDAKTLVGV